jgi:hypothetical protein
VKSDNYLRVISRVMQLFLILFWVGAVMIAVTSLSSAEWFRYWPAFLFAAVLTGFLWMVAEFFVRSSE